MLGMHAILQTVALEYAIDSRWRNRSEFINARDEVIAFLSCKWARELDYRLIKEMWAFTKNNPKTALDCNFARSSCLTHRLRNSAIRSRISLR
jgi:nuclear transport factor 2 (NTF2) superfamily protein